MSKIFKEPSKIKLPRAKFEESEFGPGKQGVMICKQCDAYYRRKAWHHGKVEFLGKKENRDIELGRVLCPACQMVKDKLYAGRIVLKDVPKDKEGEVMNLCENYCERAWKRDPLDRLISLRKEKGLLVVTVSENQLAQRLAKKIKDTYHKVSLKISHVSEPSRVTLINLTFIIGKESDEK